MSKRLVNALTGVGLIGIGLFAAQAMAAPPVGDAAAGVAKSATCAACHGMDGNSPAAQWPKLAGQQADYIYRQTVIIRDGEREVLEMMPFVQGMSDQDIADIAAYYATQVVRPGVADDSAIVGRDDDETYADLGQKIYRAGKPSAGVPACMACHGPTGRGVAGAGFPGLAGQHGTYTAARLRYFHQGNQYGRGDDPSTIMTRIAQRLDETEIDAVATFIEGLHRVDPSAASAAAPAAAAPTAMPAAAPPAEPASADMTAPNADPAPPIDGAPVPAAPPAGDEAPPPDDGPTTRPGT